MTQLSMLFAQQDDSGAAAASVALIVYLGFIAVFLAGMWTTFAKAGKPGWACIIPIYNVIVLLEIAGKPIWWILLLLIPLVNIVVSILVAIDVANRFGKGAGFGVGLAFLPFIFYPILGFGDAHYQMGAPSRA